MGNDLDSLKNCCTERDCDLLLPKEPSLNNSRRG